MSDATLTEIQTNWKSPTPHPLQALKDQYDKLCAQRDATYAEAQPYEDQLTEVNAQIDALSHRQKELTVKIETIWGGPAWIALKKQIAALAKALGAPGGILAVKR